jgi:pyrimidine nucleoside transport protein
MGTRPAESACVAGNLFVGMSESPLLVAPYLPMMSRSEICAIMAAGFSTIAGSVYQAYVSFGVSESPLVLA